MNNHNNKRFCSRECHNLNQKAGGKQKICDAPGCETDFWVKSHKIEDQQHHFCSQDCKGQWLSENNTGEDHPNYQRVTVECDFCGTPKEVVPSWAEKDHHFCDKECRANWVSENYSGEDSPHWKGGKVEVECFWEECHETLEKPQANIDTYDRHFCSEECRGNWLSKFNSGSDNPVFNSVEIECSLDGCETTRMEVKSKVNEDGNYCSRECAGEARKNRVTVSCAWCGEVEERPKSQVYSKSFCSSECLGRYYSEYRSGENHPLWQGGTRKYYGPTWVKMRRKVREKYGYKCIRCGKSREELGQNPDVHHIVPIRNFDCFSDGNTLDNLVSLCRSCHRIVENMPVRPQFPS